jgi:hypothetical protein
MNESNDSLVIGKMPSSIAICNGYYIIILINLFIFLKQIKMKTTKLFNNSNLFTR